MGGLENSRSAQPVDDLDRALAWMNALGVEVDPGRPTAYRKMALMWDDLVAGRSKLGARELAPIVATLGYELDAFVAIHRAFSGRARAELGDLIAQLSQAAGGPVRIDDARSSDERPARSALFRALTAAYLQQATGNVTPGALGGAGFSLGRHHIHVASRRLPHGADIAASIQSECTHLLSALDGRPGPRSRGMVALDVSPLITPPGHAPPTQARAAMDGAADQRLANFIDAHMDALQNGLHGVDRRIIGFLLLSSSVAVAADDRAFVHAGRWVLVWREHINISDFDLLDRLRSLLRGER